MALIDRETISIPLYVFIISRLSRRFNIETSTWDECRYIGGWIGPSGVAGRIPLYPFSCWTARVEEGGGHGRRMKLTNDSSLCRTRGRENGRGIRSVGVDGPTFGYLE